jgi:parallel beta-helix repeat protein
LRIRPSHKLANTVILCVTLLLSSSSFIGINQFCIGSLGKVFGVTRNDRNCIQVPFFSIQTAINDAEDGSTIQVPAGIYNEHVTINKSISLVGENLQTTIIDGNNGGTVVQILSNNVSISGFTIRYSGWGWTNNGIYVYAADNCEIRNNYLFTNCHNIRLNYSRGSKVMENIIDGNGYGIRFLNSENCLASGNRILNCIGGIHLEYATNCTVKTNNIVQNGQGIRFYSPCTYNRVFENLVFNNTYDGMIEAMPGNTTISDNFFFHNNFINNTYPFIYKVYGSTWDDGYPSGGNYWSRYNGSDVYSGVFQNETGADGIGDTQYPINAYDADRYPLMQPYGSVENLDTNLTYFTIQNAIDASETMSGHVILVKNGVYNEHLVISKALALVGEEENLTIIDGGNIGTVVTVTADNVNVSKFTVRKSGSNFPPYGNDCGVLLDHRSGCTLSQIQIIDNRIGINLFYSTNITIDHCLVYRNRENGIWLWYSGRNTLHENSMQENAYNFGVFGGDFSDFDNSIDTGNLVEGKPIQYFIGAENVVFDNSSEASTVYLINCFNVTVKDLNLTKSGHGVFGYNVTESTIQNVTTMANNYGVYLQNSSNDTVEGNADVGDWVGIGLQDSSSIVVKRNLAADAEKGFSLYQTYNSRIEENTFRNSLFGIRLFNSNLNMFFHNNVIDNDLQVDLINSIGNVWDNGMEGNFWNDHITLDLNRDGVGDSSYTISNDLDRFPLMGNFSSYKLEQENESIVTIVTNSSIVNVAFETQLRLIRLTVEGPNDTDGFCRMKIPRHVVEPRIEVMIDGGLTQVLYANYSVHSDNANTWIYFAYKHSEHDVTIIPEFLPLTLFLASVLGVTSAFILRNRRRTDLHV